MPGHCRALLEKRSVPFCLCAALTGDKAPFAEPQESLFLRLFCAAGPFMIGGAIPLCP